MNRKQLPSSINHRHLPIKVILTIIHIFQFIVYAAPFLLLIQELTNWAHVGKWIDLLTNFSGKLLTWVKILLVAIYFLLEFKSASKF